MSRYLILALLALGALAAEPAKAPPAKLELFAKEDWYKKQEGKEAEFIGVLKFKDRGEDAVGFGRFNPYTLVMGEGAKTTVREVYVGAKPELLKPYIGKTVKLVGKAVDMEVEGNKHHEIWPARLEIVVAEEKANQPADDPRLNVETHLQLTRTRLAELAKQKEAIAKQLEALAEVRIKLEVTQRKLEALEAKLKEELLLLSKEGRLAVGDKVTAVKIVGRAPWRGATAKPGLEMQQLVIRSPEELAKAAPKGAEDFEKFLAKQFKVDKIDWKKQMVIVATGGVKPTGGYSVEITDVTVADKTMTVKWKLNSPKPGSITPQIVTHPGQAVLVDSFEGKVKFDPPASDGKRDK